MCMRVLKKLVIHFILTSTTQIMEIVCDLNYTELYKTITCPILFLPAEKEDHLNIKLENTEVFIRKQA